MPRNSSSYLHFEFLRFSALCFSFVFFVFSSSFLSDCCLVLFSLFCFPHYGSDVSRETPSSEQHICERRFCISLVFDLFSSTFRERYYYFPFMFVAQHLSHDFLCMCSLFSSTRATVSDWAYLTFLLHALTVYFSHILVYFVTGILCTSDYPLRCVCIFPSILVLTLG